MSTSVEKLSNSSLERFRSCPLSYYFQYLDPTKPEKRNVQEYYAHYGVLLHWLAEYYPRTNFYPDMERTKQEISDENDDINNLLINYGNQIMERGIILDLDKMKKIYDKVFLMIQFPNGNTAGEYYRQGLKFIEQLTQMDWSKVIALEKEFKMTLHKDLPPVVGFIDKVERDENGLIVTDYKTSKVYTPQVIAKKAQLPIYGMACYFLYGELPYKYRYHFMRFNKVVEVEISKEDLRRVYNSIRFDYQKIQHYVQSGKFPAQYNSFYCKNFCGFSYICPTFKMYEGVGA